MKYLTIILLFTCLSLNAQNWKKGLAVAGYHLGTVALGAVADGLYDSGNKEWSHALHAAEVGALISGPFVFNLSRKEALPYLSSYVFLRMATFDPMYNATYGRPLNDIGGTSLWDKALQSVNSEPSGYWFARSIFFGLGVAIPIKYY